MNQETEYLNQVIRGIIKFRKCPNCDNEGIELQHYSGETGEPCLPTDTEAFREFCDDCEGLGFIQISE